MYTHAQSSANGSSSLRQMLSSSSWEGVAVIVCSSSCMSSSVCTGSVGNRPCAHCRKHVVSVFSALCCLAVFALACAVVTFPKANLDLRTAP